MNEHVEKAVHVQRLNEYKTASMSRDSPSVPANQSKTITSNRFRTILRNHNLKHPDFQFSIFDDPTPHISCSISLLWQRSLPATYNGMSPELIAAILNQHFKSEAHKARAQEVARTAEARKDDAQAPLKRKELMRYVTELRP